MERKEIVTLLSGIQAGKVSKATIKNALVSEQEQFILNNPEFVRAYELADELAPEFASGFHAKHSQINEKNTQLYGDLKSWPDSALQECISLYEGNPVFKRLSECYGRADYIEFIKWTKTESKPQSNGKE